MEYMLMLAKSAMPMEVLSQYVWPVLLMVVGFGLVIFVHELGHFIVAKAVGIKVERFSLGFGPKLFGIKRGETEYIVAALPLGGYVKMLGQEDFKPLEENEKPDPRAFNNKSVGARFGVISAGVVMNIILAAVLIVIVGMIGINFPAPVVGSVNPGFPASHAEIVWQEPLPTSATAASEPSSQPATAIASQASTVPTSITYGLEPGDTILAINGTPAGRFATVAIKAALAYKGEVFNMKIRRQISGRDYVGIARVGVKERGTMQAFGIDGALDTVVAEVINHQGLDIKSGDRLVRLAGQKIEHHWDLPDAVRNLDPLDTSATFQRDGKEITVKLPPALISGGQVYLTAEDGKTQKQADAIVAEIDRDYVQLEHRDGRRQVLPSNDVSFFKSDGEMLTILGMTPRIKVMAITPGSPADKAGLQVGDVIINYGDLGLAPTRKQLFEINDKFADRGTNIVILRDGKVLPSLWVVPKKNKGLDHALLGFLPGLDMKHLVVAGVAEHSPAAQAGISSGNEIVEINGKPVTSWQDLFVQLKGLSGQDVTLSVKRNAAVFSAPIGKLDRWAFNTNSYVIDPLNNILFRPLMVKVVHTNPAEALVWGVRETWVSTLDTYASLRAVISGTVSTAELRGPVGIGQLAFRASQQGLSYFIYLMAIISISLAVINFLPIPVVDGGHAVFLLIEKIRGKPVSIKVMNFAQVIGIVLLLGIFVFATWNDISRLFTQ